MIKIRVEMFSFRHIQSSGRVVMISGQNVIDIIETAWTETNLGEISRPDPSVSIFGFFLRIIGRVNTIMD